MNNDNDPILDLDNQNKHLDDGSPDDLFKNEFDDLENEFNNMQMGNDMQQKRGNPFGQSITKELLQ